MKCAVCGGELRTATTNLPFKVSDATIVILKDLPVVQCARCPEYLIEDEVLRRVDEIWRGWKADRARDRPLRRVIVVYASPNNGSSRHAARRR